MVMYAFCARLDDCGIDDNGCRFIGNMKWPHLEMLQIGNHITDSAMNKITSTGIKHFINSLPKLKELYLGT